MRVVIQRVRNAKVLIEEKVFGAINQGLLILVGIEETDTSEDVEWLCAKITQLRIFNDDAGVMNRSLLEIKGEILLISQFTLHAATRKGNRPSYIRAAKPAVAVPLYESMITRLSEIAGKTIATGKFGADMQVELLNDGPVTILIDSKNKE